MATTNKKGKEKEKINYNTLFMRNAIKPKDLVLWVPTRMDPLSPVGELVSYLENIENVTRIDNQLYDNDFINFYGMEIREKYDNTIKEDHYFCANKIHGGVDEGYIIESANNPTNGTIMSVKLNSNGEFEEIYGLATFKISEKKRGIKIHTLCGNQALPGSGEGTRLKNLLEKVGDKIGYDKVFLNPLDSAMKYYSGQQYRFTTNADSSSSASDYESMGSSDSSDVRDTPVVMQKNMKALKGWAKVRNATRTIGMLQKRRAANERLQLEKKYTQKAMEKEASRPIKLDLRTMKERSTKIVPGASFANTTKFVPKPKQGIPSKLIVPGESFVMSNKKAEILNAADASRRKEVDEIIARLEREKAQQKTSKKKTGKGNKTKTRKN